ncbi:MAG: hypothetical protein Q9M40_00120 [Sulfurimonas sp.]|nr:hypothetical protein [Sulfurimonas sp.]
MPGTSRAGSDHHRCSTCKTKSRKASAEFSFYSHFLL